MEGKSARAAAIGLLALLACAGCAGGNAPAGPVLQSIDATYNGPKKAGRVISDTGAFSLMGTWSDGSRKTLGDCSVARPVTLKAGDNTVSITCDGKTADERITVPKIASIKAKYDGPNDPGAKIETGAAGVHVYAVDDSGFSQEVDGWTIDNPGALSPDAPSSFTVSYEGLKTQLEAPRAYRIVSLKAAYDGPTAPGTAIAAGDANIHVTGVDDAGAEHPLKDGWTIDNPGALQSAQDTTFIIDYKGAKGQLTIAGDPPLEYQHALETAQDYSDDQHMSKKRLYKQLTSEYGEGFDKAAAQYAVDHVKADWKANALETAKSYRESMHMSKSRLYRQLTSEYGEQFTADEARYAVDNLPN